MYTYAETCFDNYPFRDFHACNTQRYNVFHQFLNESEKNPFQEKRGKTRNPVFLAAWVWASKYSVHTSQFHISLKIRRGPKLEGYAFANFGYSSGTEGESPCEVGLF